MKYLFALLCGTLAHALVTHTSTTKNLRIPYGTFAHFRLVGSGTDDPNLDADITSVGYDLAIKSLQHGTTNGVAIYNPFDLYLFSSNNDYDCFVMGSVLWADYNIKQTCDFVTQRPQIIKSSLLNYSESSPNFLSHSS